MNFFDYFTKGLANTLKFKNRANLSYKGEAIPVYSNTIVDTWYLGDFTSANYEITIEHGNDDVEHVNVLVTARVDQASAMVYSRTNLGRDLVQFSATVNASKVTLIANPFYEADNITPLTNVKLIFKVTYSERIGSLPLPQTVGESTAQGGEPGITRNWLTGNLPNGALEVNGSGQIVFSYLKTVTSPTQATLNSGFLLSSLNFKNTDGFINITTNSVSSTVLNSNATALELGTGRSAVSASWDIANGVIKLQSSGLPYHSYGNPSAITTPSNQNYNTTFSLRAGTNVSLPVPVAVTSDSTIGYLLNGVALLPPGAGSAVPDGEIYDSYYPTWEYNAAYGAHLAYTFGEDLAGGIANVSGKYFYRDYSFNTAWETGVGNAIGATTSGGTAEITEIPYLDGSLLHTDGHSKILGFALDGYPIYGPYGYDIPTSKSSGIRRMVTGYEVSVARSGIGAPPIDSTYPMGTFVQDYHYAGSGDLDAHNGRYCVTPDYPNGTYAYFFTIDSSGNPEFPYIIGTTFYNDPTTTTYGGGIPISSTSGTNTLKFTLNAFSGITVTNSLTATLPTGTSTINNVAIGASTPKAGKFTSLTATAPITFSGLNQTVSIAPTGTGTVTMNPATTGSINNVTFGAGTPRSARFTTLSITSLPPTGQNEIIPLGKIQARLLYGAI